MDGVPGIDRKRRARLLDLLFFVLAYVAMDAFSYIEPLFGLDITPWNPPVALGLVYWLKYGRSLSPYWLAAVLIGEAVIRGFPEGAILTFAISALLVAGYGLTGEWLRRHFTV